MTPLRQRMLEDMQIRNLALSTQETYVRQVARFAVYSGGCPSKLGPREVRAYQLYLTKERKVSSSVVAQVVAALRFLYGTTLHRPWTITAIPYPRTRKKLPVVLTRAEVAQFLGTVRNVKHRARGDPDGTRRNSQWRRFFLPRDGTNSQGRYSSTRRRKRIAG